MRITANLQETTDACIGDCQLTTSLSECVEESRSSIIEPLQVLPYLNKCDTVLNENEAGHPCSSTYAVKLSDLTFTGFLKKNKTDADAPAEDLPYTSTTNELQTNSSSDDDDNTQMRITANLQGTTDACIGDCQPTTSLSVSGGKVKPQRPCTYCGQFKSDIRSHLIHAHKNEDRVKQLKFMAAKERISALAALRKEGIFKKNKEIIAHGGQHSKLLCERKSEGVKVVCSRCSGTFNQAYFRKHKKLCISAKEENPAIPLNDEYMAPSTTRVVRSSVSEWHKVLRKMAKDKFFRIIESDSTILLVGKHIFDSRKPAKHKEARIKSRSAMRRLARLLDLTEDVSNVADLFLVHNFYLLEESIKELCKSDDKGNSVKSGLKVALGSLVRTTAKILAADYIINQQKVKAEEIEQFEKVFNLSYAKIFSDAEYRLKEKSHRENRKPTALPDENHLAKLRLYLLGEIPKTVAKMLSGHASSDYVHLRKITLTRVTLLNGRRGSEPARMVIQDFLDRDSWIRKNELGSIERKLLEQYALMFVMGKGTSLIPILVPNDCVEAIKILVDPQVRKEAGVCADNQFIFAYTQESQDCCIGYNEIMDVCHLIDIPVITSTSVRHRTSTIFWNLEGIDTQTVDTFMDHMGHSKEIDRNIYAVPPALNTLRTVAPIITHLDKIYDDTSDDVSSESECDDKSHSGRKSLQINQRSYKRWDASETNVVVKYFMAYIDGSKGNVYPKKQELLDFVHKYNVNADCKTMKTKIFNEKQKLKVKIDKMVC